MKKRASILQKSRDAQSVIAKHGVAAWLVLICALLMSFLAIYTFTLSGVASSLSTSWEKTLRESATLRVPADLIDEDSVAIAQNILDTTAGIVSYEQLDDDQQIALIAPWLGDSIPQNILALPAIFTTVIDPDNFDTESLKLRLEGELPEAIWDDHQRWRGPLLDSAERLKWLSRVSTLIIASAFVFLIFVSAEASIYSNANSIDLLRQIGATDEWIVNGFLRKFVMRCVIGSVIGIALGMIATRGLLSGNVGDANFFTNISVSTIQWSRAIIVLLASGILCYLATYLATHRYLRRIR